MLFDANFSTAVRCVNCGSFNIIDVSLFELYKSGMYLSSCKCGAEALRVKSSDCKTFRVYVPCIVCDKEHLYTINSKKVLIEKLKILDCTSTKVEIAFIGNSQLIREAVAKYERDLQELMDVLEV